ncbi:MAG: hypothetical protein P1V18_05770 [Candidatus Gracilibacteria bacterium]|nr:hypothetical protein [Candidatus Gracilibacteria bacterium]
MDFFLNRTALLATQHQKEKVIAPILESALGITVLVPKEINTDQFGTFTREKKRHGTAQEVVKKKALHALDTFGGDLSIASEGSFGNHPSIPFIISNQEIVTLIDKKHQLTISGVITTAKTNLWSQYISNTTELKTLIKKHDFPNHGLLLRYHPHLNFGIHKDIKTSPEILHKASKMLSKPFIKKIYVETDMRAHRNPTRMKAIQLATESLLKNIKSLCPSCNLPGYIVKKTKGQKNCKECKTPTKIPLYNISICQHCNHKENTHIGIETEVKAMYCNYCNP